MKLPPFPGNLDEAAEAWCIIWSIKEDLRIFVSPLHFCDVLGTGTEDNSGRMIETRLERVKTRYS